jgi:hypothetical protein
MCHIHFFLSFVYRILRGTRQNDFELEAWIQGRDFPIRFDPGGVVPLGRMLRAVSRVDAAGTQWVLQSFGSWPHSDAGDIQDCI